MVTIHYQLPVFMLFFASSLVTAEIHKCVNADGVVQFQEAKCSNHQVPVEAPLLQQSTSRLQKAEADLPVESSGRRFGSPTLQSEDGAWKDLSLPEKCEIYSKMRNRGDDLYTKWDLKYDTYCP